MLVEFSSRQLIMESHEKDIENIAYGFVGSHDEVQKVTLMEIEWMKIQDGVLDPVANVEVYILSWMDSPIGSIVEQSR